MASGDVNITVVGNVVADPELRFTSTGAAVATFRVASTPRRYDSQSGQWVDGEALFLTCNVWRQVAENIAETLTKGYCYRSPPVPLVRYPEWRSAYGHGAGSR